MKYRVEIGEKSYEVEVEEIGINEFKVTVNGKTVIFELKPKSEAKEVKQTEIRAMKREERTSEPKTEGKVVKAPMNGMVTKILVKLGDEVKEGDTLIVIEAMKMENPIKAPFGGKILEIFVKVGDKVSKDAPLLRLG
ncbi:MAG: biotin/lipoyl-containing protein [Archaeoglobaceae archaeon]